VHNLFLFYNLGPNVSKKFVDWPKCPRSKNKIKICESTNDLINMNPLSTKVAVAYHRLPAYDQTFIYIFIICATFWLIKNVMEASPQALQIIFEVQRKRSNEKITRKKLSFSTYKTRFFVFLWTHLFFFSFNLTSIPEPERSIWRQLPSWFEQNTHVV
jgi:hypothetical protein